MDPLREEVRLSNKVDIIMLDGLEEKKKYKCLDCSKELGWWEVWRHLEVTGCLFWKKLNWIEPLCHKCFWKREGD